MYHINTVLCPIKVHCNTIELTMHTSCFCASYLLCVIKETEMHYTSQLEIWSQVKKIKRLLEKKLTCDNAYPAGTTFLRVCWATPAVEANL